MSILSKLADKAITWGEAAKEIVAWGQAIVSHNPAAQAVVAASVSAVKQAASNAVAYADTALATHMSEITQVSHATADAALEAVTGGKLPPEAIVLANGVVDQIEAAGVAAFHAWALQQKASNANAALAAAPQPALNLPLSNQAQGLQPPPPPLMGAQGQTGPQLTALAGAAP